MKRTRITIALASSLLVAQIATAQMMGGGNHPGPVPPPAPGGNPSGGMNGGDLMGDMSGGMGQSLTVGTDGVVYALRASAATAVQSPAVEVVAIRPTGTIAWTTKIEGRMTRLALAGNLVLVSSGAGDMGMDEWNGNEGDDTSHLFALSTVSGAVQWQLDLDGFVGALEPFAGGVYALVIEHNNTDPGMGMHNGSNGTTPMKRSVTAIDNAGKVLWSIAL